MKKILILILLLLLTSCESTTSFIDTSNNEDESVDSKLLIDLKGEVLYPNIYSVNKGITLYELINKAGGFTKNANTSNINLATILNENQMITIPSLIKDIDENIQNNLININKASLKELCNLPGIGQSKAQNIIDYRNNNGVFSSVDDIKKVNGIGEELFAKIKDYICI